jgi:hypothetical protein
MVRTILVLVLVLAILPGASVQAQESPYTVTTNISLAGNGYVYLNFEGSRVCSHSEKITVRARNTSVHSYQYVEGYCNHGGLPIEFHAYFGHRCRSTNILGQLSRCSYIVGSTGTNEQYRGGAWNNQ